MKMKQMLPVFVEEIPQNIDEGILYVCLHYNSIIHKCACGCGEIVSTPLDRKYGWTMKYEGEYISIYQYIGNGAYNCQSHYYIRDNEIVWLGNIKVQKTQEETGKINVLYRVVKRIKSFWK